jgi:hypothetical protein
VECQDRRTGVFASGVFPSGVKFATDASGGSSSADARSRCVTWAVIAADVSQNPPVVLGTMAGHLPGASVYRGEAHARHVLASEVAGVIDVTIDCLGVRKAWVRGRGSLFDTLWWQHRSDHQRVHIHWINSHLSKEAFSAKIQEPDWRRQLNHEPDQVCGSLAAELHDSQLKRRIQRVDRCAVAVSLFLAERIQLLCQASEKERALFRRARKKAPPGQEAVLNKKARLLALVAGTGETHGHLWAVASQSGNNLCLACSRCRLWIQQVYAPETFDRLLRQECAGRGSYPEPWQIHSSHRMGNLGVKWQCQKCGAAQRPAAVTTNPKLSRPCVGVRGLRSTHRRPKDSGPPKIQSLLQFKC